MFVFYHGLFGFQQVCHRPGRAIHVSDGVFNVTFLGQRERTAGTAASHRARRLFISFMPDSLEIAAHPPRLSAIAFAAG